jgi:hypothetical protein
MSGSNNTYTCTCTRFCKGYKTGLSHATFYRHAPYHDAPQPGFSASFQAFLHNSGASGPSTSSNLAAENFQEESGCHEDETFDNEVEDFQNQKVGLLTYHLIYIYIPHLSSPMMLMPTPWRTLEIQVLL